MRNRRAFRCCAGPFCHRALLTLEQKKVPYVKNYVDLGNKPDWWDKSARGGALSVQGPAAMFAGPIARPWHAHVLCLPRHMPVHASVGHDFPCHAPVCRLLKLNPAGTVPVLQDLETGKVITDSGDITDYIEDLYPEPAVGHTSDTKNVYVGNGARGIGRDAWGGWRGSDASPRCRAAAVAAQPGALPCLTQRCGHLPGVRGLPEELWQAR